MIQLDLDAGLANICDGSFDYVVLNRTLQEMRDPRRLLGEILRVGKKAIISFPNFGQWTVRTALWWRGRMPKSKSLPYEWYDTPNIHLLTINDFKDFCKDKKIKIIQEIYMNKATIKKGILHKFFPNFFAEEAIFIVAKNNTDTLK